MPLQVLPADAARPFLLAADIDGTLIDAMNEPSWLCDFVAQHPHAVIAAYVTGRSFPSVCSLIGKGLLPAPRFVCSHVGSQIIEYADPAGGFGALFTSRVRDDAWSLEAIYDAGAGHGIERQRFSSGQPPFHAGFSWDGRQQSFLAFCQRLSGFSALSIIPSHGMFIDVIPASLGKGRAVRFLWEHLGIEKEKVVVAGDSGNDYSLFDTPFNGIIPANSIDSLGAVANKPHHYHSRYAAGAGVLDGLCRFGYLKMA